MKLVIGAVAVVALTGCTIERTIVQEATTTTSPPITQYVPPVTTLPVGGDEIGFINSIENTHGDLAGSEQLALDTGYAVCAQLDAGTSPEVIKQAILQSATDADSVEFLSYVTAAAVVFLCPWHIDTFNAFV